MDLKTTDIINTNDRFYYLLFITITTNEQNQVNERKWRGADKSVPKMKRKKKRKDDKEKRRETNRRSVD